MAANGPGVGGSEWQCAVCTLLNPTGQIRVRALYLSVCYCAFYIVAACFTCGHIGGYCAGFIYVLWLMSGREQLDRHFHFE